MTTSAGIGLRGRVTERRILDRLLAEGSTGHSRALLLTGDRGIGKTTLLGDVVRRAAGFQILYASGVESEAGLAYAGLQQLCAPLLHRLEHLPRPQRDALASAFGRGAGASPDRFLVGLAGLGLLAEAAGERPVLCVVDDVQWLDESSALTLTFMARRLNREAVVLLLAGRPAEGSSRLRTVPELVIRGLEDTESRGLLDEALHGPLDDEVRDRILLECRGNPGALLEVPSAGHPADLVGGFALPPIGSAPQRTESGFEQELRHLPDQARRLLVLAAADPTGDPALLWRAAAKLGLGLQDADPAEAAGLIDIGIRVRFRHPVVRWAAYRAATSEQRQLVHWALAQATDPDLCADRRAWHRGRSTTEPDEAIAADLERCADAARVRGGWAAAAGFLERAVALTPRRPQRAERALAAGRAKIIAGAVDDAAVLLDVARAGPLDDAGVAVADLLRGRLALASPHRDGAAAVLLDAARRLDRSDHAAAADALLDAFTAAFSAGRLGGTDGLTAVATATRSAARSGHQDPRPDMGSPEERPVDRLLDALATMVIDGLPVAAPRLQQAVAAAVGAEESPHPDDGRRLELTARAARQLWDEAGWRELSDRRLALARGSGALAELPAALEDRVQLHLLAGENGEAAELVAELEAIAGSVRTGRPPYGAITLGAWHGHEPEVSALVRPAVEDAINRGEGAAIGAIRYAQAVLYNGLGRYDEALLAAADGAGDPGELGWAGWSLVELIEAAVRCRQRDTAATALGRLLDTTGPSGTSWAQGVEARSRALLAGDDAGDLYRNAIDHLGRTALPMELARTQLLYGEWLRRRRRRSAARECLRAAHATFVAVGADGFAERARRERLATGETVRAHRREPSDDLTAQEVQIARLAVDGRTNPEIAAELFLSPRTVEWHLRKVFTKLSISSRRQLRTVLPDVVRAGTRS